MPRTHHSKPSHETSDSATELFQAQVIDALQPIIGKYPRAEKEHLLVQLVRELLTDAGSSSEIPICDEGQVIGYFVPATVGFITRSQLEAAEEIKRTVAPEQSTLKSTEVLARLKEVRKPATP